jgi:Skp family chaperone for outer membrane proteins
MKHFSFCLVVLFLSLLVSTDVSAQHKIGYINMDDLVGAMRETKQARQTLKAYADSLSRVYGGMQQGFVEKRNDFFRDSARMDTATKETHRRELQKIIQQVGQFQADSRAQLDSVQQALAAAVTTKAEEAIAATAKANGYAYVFRKVIIGPDGDDLLPLVKKQLGLDTQ